MHSICLLTSMELIPIPDCSSLYMHSNDMNSFEKFIHEKVATINIIINKKTKIKTSLISQNESLFTLTILGQSLIDGTRGDSS